MASSRPGTSPRLHVHRFAVGANGEEPAPAAAEQPPAPDRRLAAELVERVLGLVDGTRELAACARVCKMWYPIATVRLWRSLDLSLPDEKVFTSQFQAYLALRPAVAPFVRPSTVTLHAIEDDDLPLVAMALKSLAPRVTIWRVLGWTTGATHTLSMVAREDLVTELCLDVGGLREDVKWLERLVPRCTSLARLAVYNAEDNLLLEDLSLCTSLRKLRVRASPYFEGLLSGLYQSVGAARQLDFVSFQDDAYELGDGKLEFLRGLNGLATLDLRPKTALRWNTQLAPLLRAVGAKLETLWVSNVAEEDDGTHRLARPGPLRQACPKLRELVLQECYLRSMASVSLYIGAFPLLRVLAVVDLSMYLEEDALGADVVATAVAKRPALRLALTEWGETPDMWHELGFGCGVARMDWWEVEVADCTARAHGGEGVAAEAE